MFTRSRRLVTVRCAAAAALVVSLGFGETQSALAAEPNIERSCARYAATGVNVAVCVRDLRIVRSATAKYRDPNVALRDGFIPAAECYKNDENSAGGVMGEHWVHRDRHADQRLDLREPELLLSLPTPGGGRKLVAVEWSIAALEDGMPHYGAEPPDPARTSPASQMFGGRSFNGPMQGHNLLQAWPFAVHLSPGPWHYDQHVWLWEKNPDGIFAQYNRALSCEYEHAGLGGLLQSAPGGHTMTRGKDVGHHH
ncbi:MAG: hypothetical protein M3P04_13400 [Actinomycetota bacterium]|nr:hypothetical protein [Actinomycetota bacterium]